MAHDLESRLCREGEDQRQPRTSQIFRSLLGLTAVRTWVQRSRPFVSLHDRRRDGGVSTCHRQTAEASSPTQSSGLPRSESSGRVLRAPMDATQNRASDRTPSVPWCEPSRRRRAEPDHRGPHRHPGPRPMAQSAGGGAAHGDVGQPRGRAGSVIGVRGLATRRDGLPAT